MSKYDPYPFFDGTGNDKDDFNKFGKPFKGVDPLSAPSHVAALFWMYSGVNKFYENGVGTRTEKALGNIGGKGAKERLNDMFKNFEDTYQRGKGDTDIDIIGFSRGAALAREFANMIYDKYPKAKIRFLGLFDTVAQVGIPNDLNINTGIRLKIADNVKFAAHAIARNEYRELFPLSSVVKYYGGTEWGFGYYAGLVPGIEPKRYMPKEYKDFHTKYVWEKPFDGAHSDIGGGYADGTNLEALKWMYSTAVSHGVKLNWKSKEFQTRESAYKQVLRYHDSRWGIDKVPFTDAGRYSRCIYKGTENFL
jgi:uncharacterized protein (DUF2235 family)